MRLRIGDDVKEALKLLYRADKSAMLEGPTGIGKSELVKETAAEIGIDCITLDLTVLEPTDLTGLPVIEVGKTFYAPPSILPTIGKDGRGGILFFDEVNRARREMINTCLQLLTARKSNNYRLPPKWVPFAAINPSNTEDYNVEPLDLAVRTRFSLIEVEADPKNWLAWAEKNSVHEAVLSFVRATPDIFKSERSTPRSWTYASDVIKAFETGDNSKIALRAAVGGFVGATLSTAFLKFYDGGQGATLIEPEKIIKSYAKVRAAVQEYARQGNTAMLHSVLMGLLTVLQNPSVIAAAKKSKSQKANLSAFRGDLPAEFRTKFDKHHPCLTQ